MGFISNANFSNDPAMVRDPPSYFPKGSLLQCHVLGRVPGHVNHANLSLVPREKAPSETLPNDSVGKSFPGKVEKVDPVEGLRVRLNNGHLGLVELVEIADDFKDTPTTGFKVGQAVECRVVKVNGSGGLVKLSLRPLASRKPVQAADQEEEDLTKHRVINSVQEAKVSMKIKGYVKETTSKGVLVKFGSELSALVKLSETTNTKQPLETIKKIFPSGKLVVAMVQRWGRETIFFFFFRF